MENVQGKYRRFLLGMLLAGCMAPLSAAWASTVNISSMLVNNASLTVSYSSSYGNGSYSFSGPVVPPADILMGTYQNPIYTANITSGATGTATIYSTGAYGKPAPSGSIDTGNATNPISVDFSSFRLNVNVTAPITLSFDVPAWPVTTPNSTSAFDALTNAYTLGWNNNFSVMAMVDGISTPISGNVQVTLGGTLQPVPVPAALWLFGSGLIGLAAFTCRRRAIPLDRSAA